MNHPLAHMRTGAYRFIRLEGPPRSYGASLCERLCTERALYAKIELCETLAACGGDALEYLNPLIGAIGGNQHGKPGNYDLKKSSYPLPRDIVARILIRIGPPVLVFYRDRLADYPERALAEILDALGHISYHSGNGLLAEELLGLYRKGPTPLIRWKLIRAFQGLAAPSVGDALARAAAEEDGVLQREAARSLERRRARFFP